MFSLANLLLWKISRKPNFALSSNNASFIVDKIKNALTQHGDSITIQKSYVSLPVAVQVVHQDDVNTVYLKKGVTVCLDDWTSYLKSNVSYPPSESRSLHVLLRTTHPSNETRFLEQLLGIPAESRVELLNICHPLAWKAGDPFHIICECSENEFLQMSDAFCRDYLIMHEMLQIDSISIVGMNGRPQELIPSQANHYLDTRPIYDLCTSDSNIADEDESITGTACRSQSDGSVTEGFYSSPEPTAVSAVGVTESGKSGINSTGSVTSQTRYIDKCASIRPDGKPPNILVYTGKKFATSVFNDIKDLLVRCVGTESYTVYHLKYEHVNLNPWQDNCKLLVISVEQLHDGVDDVFMEYFHAGGKILSCCSTLDKKILDCVENENCNHLKVVSTRFDTDDINLVQGRYYYRSPDSSLPEISTEVIANNHLMQPVIIQASSYSKGCCILSQVHLERSPIKSSVNSDMVSQLNATENGRIKSVKAVLSLLGVIGDAEPTSISVTPAHIICFGSESLKSNLLERISKSHTKKISDKVLTIPNVAEVLIDSSQDSIGSFNFQVYKDSLNSVTGNTVIYQEIAKSTQLLVEPFLFCSPPDCGLVAIAQRQISGVGRGDNSWISPPGSLSISMHLRIDMMSNLGQALALIQTVPAVAVARFMANHLPLSSLKDDSVKVKWPNDIYYKGSKIGGIIVKSTILQRTLHAVVGLGVNVYNPKPTVNLNDVLNDYRLVHGVETEDLTVEYVAAKVCSELEKLIDLLQNDKKQYLAEYYKFWIHDGGRVDVPHEGVFNALIVGLDDHGFLLLERPDSSRFSVQPDGNSFDIMHNMIKVK